MAVPSNISELSTTPGSNPPSGADSPSVLDDHLRTVYAFIKTASDAQVALTGNQTIAGVKTFSSTPVVPDDSFAFSKLQNIATARVLGRITASSGDIEELTQAQAAELSSHAGQVGWFAMNSAPGGWLKANGALVSRTTYAALFSAIGTTFGAGDGSTTFALPDLRGEFIRGWDDGKGTDSGRVFGSAQLDAMQQITGTFDILDSTSDASIVQGDAGAFTRTANAGAVTGQGFLTRTADSRNTDRVSFDSADSTDARTSTETRPRNIALLACIKF